MCALMGRQGSTSIERADGPSRTSTEHVFVVPAYGRSPFLDGCLASLKGQTSPSHILVTTSTPSSFTDEAAGRHAVPVLVSPVREGIAEDWNFALRATEARYVTLAHQDDVYAPTFAARTLDAFARHAGALCFTGYDEIDDAGLPATSKISMVKHLLAAAVIGDRPRPSLRRVRAFLSLGNPLPCSSVTLDRVRLPDFAFCPDYASNLDWDAWWRIVDGGERFLSVPERLVGRRHNALTATSRLIADGRRRSEDLAMFRRIWPRPFSEAVAAAYRLGY